MPDKYRAKLQAAPEASFHVLEPEKAKRMNAATLYIPSTEDVKKVISEIPCGSTMTVVEIRLKLAREHNAETACPAVTIKYWKWFAYAMEDEGGEEIPWWRVLKDGKVNDTLPASHFDRLVAEGVEPVRSKKSTD